MLTVRDPATGLAEQKWYSGFPDAEAAEKKKTALLKALDDNTWVEPATVTVAAYFRKWLEDRRADAEAPLAARTAQRYEDFIERFIVPGLGALRLQRLGAFALKGFLKSAKDGTLALPAVPAGGKAPRPRRSLAPRTVRHLGALVRQALDEAVEDGLLARNPAPCPRLNGRARTVGRSPSTRLAPPRSWPPPGGATSRACSSSR